MLLNKVDYAMSVCDGMIVEVFKIAAWLPCHTTLQGTRDTVYEKEIYDKDERLNKLEFVGNLAEDNIRDKYKGRMVDDWLKFENPVYYVWGKEE